MKKLIIALSVALLALTACEEKTATYDFNGVQITYPASWKVDDLDSFVYIQDQKVLSNSADIQVYEFDANQLAQMPSEDLAESLQNMVYNMYTSSTESDDYVITYESDIDGTDTQALMSFSGTAYGDAFSGGILAWYDENYAIVAFFSGKDDKELLKIMDIFDVKVL